MSCTYRLTRDLPTEVVHGELSPARSALVAALMRPFRQAVGSRGPCAGKVARQASRLNVSTRFYSISRCAENPL